jgi:hypothetical protein
MHVSTDSPDLTITHSCPVGELNSAYFPVVGILEDVYIAVISYDI